ncbi:MAG: glycosyltransferase family 39 protein [Pseudolysinimonas sp.]
MTALDHASRTIAVPARTPLPLWAVGLGVAGASVSAVGLGTPSYWGDEAASVMSASRPLWSLWAELAHIDAVHGLYYLALHFWIEAFGTSEAATRLPSVIAAGFAIAGTVVLGTELLGLRRGIIAGVIVAVLPELTRMAIETRSYAFAIAAAVWLTWLLVRMVRRRESRRWVWMGYAVATALSIYLFLYLAFMLLVAVVVVLVEHPPRSVVRSWARAIVVVAVVTAPFVVVAIGEQQQIAFLANRDYVTFNNIVVRQWFGHPLAATLGWSLILVGFALTLAGRHVLGMTEMRAMGIIAGWLVAPTLLLVVGNAVHPMYNMRYVAFCVPAVAMAVAVGIDRLADLARVPSLRKGLVVVLIGAVLAACVPSYLGQRTPYSKDGGSDLRLIATTIDAHAKAGDAVVFDSSVVPRRKPRLALDLYPNDFAGLTDVALLTSYVDRQSLWDRVSTVDSAVEPLLGHLTVWAVESNHSASTDLEALERIGYTVVDTLPLHRTTIYELRRAL